MADLGLTLASVLAGVRALEDAGLPASDGVVLVYRRLLALLAQERGAQAGPPPDGPNVDLAGLPERPEDLPAALVRLHESVIRARDPGARRGSGSFYTPPSLVEHLLDLALEPALDEAPDPAGVTVLDPACGPGGFLVAAARRIARRGVPVSQAVHQVHGVDLDAAAVELARGLLWLELARPGARWERPPLALSVADALLDWTPPHPFDVVVGNPPFLNRLHRRTAPDRELATRLEALAPGVLGPYTDLSAVFLHRAVGWAREPGGRVALVQPQSLLAARDAAGVRRVTARTCVLEHLWASDTPVFEAGVRTCAPVLRRGGVQGEVTRTHGPGLDSLPPAHRPDLSGTWSFLLGAGLGIPEVVLGAGSGVLGDLATCTADFRDQYYGLAGAVYESAERPGGTPLVTAGLVDPARCLWGQRPARVLKRRWAAPVVDLAALSDGPLAAWARTRLVPKVLVATQSRIIEAVVDETGAWLPSVPTITVTASPEQLWHVLAVLLAPPISAYAATTYAGTALTMHAVKLSARQVAALPLPEDTEAWHEGARLARATQREGGGREALLAMGRAMTAAYGADASVLHWWSERLVRGHPADLDSAPSASRHRAGDSDGAR